MRRAAKHATSADYARTCAIADVSACLRLRVVQHDVALLPRRGASAPASASCPASGATRPQEHTIHLPAQKLGIFLAPAAPSRIRSINFSRCGPSPMSLQATTDAAKNAARSTLPSSQSRRPAIEHQPHEVGVSDPLEKLPRSELKNDIFGGGAGNTACGRSSFPAGPYWRRS